MQCQACNIQLILQEFDKATVELVPDTILIPEPIEMSQYVLDAAGVTLDYLQHGQFVKILT